jgi:hypothetical protein
MSANRATRRGGWLYSGDPRINAACRALLFAVWFEDGLSLSQHVARINRAHLRLSEALERVDGDEWRTA